MLNRIRQWWRDRKLARQARQAPRYRSGGYVNNPEARPRVLHSGLDLRRDDPRWRAAPVDDVALYSPECRLPPNFSPLHTATTLPSDDRCPPPAHISDDRSGGYGGSSDSGSYDSGSSDSGGSCGGGGGGD